MFLFQYDGQSKLPIKLPSEPSRIPHIDDDISTITIKFSQKTTREKLEQLLQHILWDGVYDPLKILRLKANINIISTNGEENSVLVQGVNDTYDIFEKPNAKFDESVFVIIAKSIDSGILHKAIYSTLKIN